MVKSREAVGETGEAEALGDRLEGANISGFVFINNATGNQVYSKNIDGVGFSGTPEDPYTANDNEQIKNILKNIDTRVPELTRRLQNSTITRTKEERGKLFVFLDLLE